MLVLCLNIVVFVFILLLNYLLVFFVIDILYKVILVVGFIRVLFCRKVGILGVCKRIFSKILNLFIGFFL